jgi:hypothetical protein
MTLSNKNRYESTDRDTRRSYHNRRDSHGRLGSYGRLGRLVRRDKWDSNHEGWYGNSSVRDYNIYNEDDFTIKKFEPTCVLDAVLCDKNLTLKQILSLMELTALGGEQINQIHEEIIKIYKKKGQKGKIEKLRYVLLVNGNRYFRVPCYPSKDLLWISHIIENLIDCPNQNIVPNSTNELAWFDNLFKHMLDCL